jgi:hypothetical protein
VLRRARLKEQLALLFQGLAARLRGAIDLDAERRKETLTAPPCVYTHTLADVRTAAAGASTQQNAERVTAAMPNSRPTLL